MTYEELEALLDEHLPNKKAFIDLPLIQTLEKYWGPVERAYQRGGEGMGSRFTTVLHFKEHDIYVQLDGYYSSYDGVDYSGYNYYQVIPEQKEVTIYE